MIIFSNKLSKMYYCY